MGYPWWPIKYTADRQYIVAPAAKRAQMNRIAKHLRGRKCAIEVKHTKRRSLIIIYM